VKAIKRTPPAEAGMIFFFKGV